MPEEFTTGALKRFVQGQIEILNAKKKYLLRGEIAQLSYVGTEIHVMFVWVAQNDGFPNALSNEWTRVDLVDIRFDTATERGSEHFHVVDIGMGKLSLHSRRSGALVTLFPHDYKHYDGSSHFLDPNRVKDPDVTIRRNALDHMESMPPALRSPSL